MCILDTVCRKWSRKGPLALVCVWEMTHLERGDFFTLRATQLNSTQLNSTELNWPSWTAYSQVSRVFVYDVKTYKLSQLLFTLSSWVQLSCVAINTPLGNTTQWMLSYVSVNFVLWIIHAVIGHDWLDWLSAVDDVELRKSDTGWYTCKALSETGETSSSAALIVETPTNHDIIFRRTPEPSTYPGPPSKATVSDVRPTSVRLAWKENPNNGASVVIAFVVEYFSPDSGEVLYYPTIHIQLAPRSSLQYKHQGFYPGLHIRGCKQEPGWSHMDIPLTYLLTYLLDSCCVCLVYPKFDIYIFSNKSRQNRLLAVSVKWISVNVNMFAIYYLSQIHHSHWYCVLTHCSLLSIIGLIVRSWFTPPP